ncbi:MAG: type II toxin-antitoxin system HicA family toxin [Candidatus Latescibacteria bacterium]|nr:type II toxin-antitoxin system HicA family toxin [Candidatus Latescibacterota bacterium]
MSIDYSKLRGVTARKITAALRSDGFYLRSQRGSHQRYHHPDGRKVTVSYHRSGDAFRPKTLRSIIERQAEWTENDLHRLKLLK